MPARSLRTSGRIGDGTELELMLLTRPVSTGLFEEMDGGGSCTRLFTSLLSSSPTYAALWKPCHLELHRGRYSLQ